LFLWEIVKGAKIIGDPSARRSKLEMEYARARVP
jgi:hypothetical protein